MPNTVRLHRVLATSPEKVYRAFLEADALAKWLPPNGYFSTSEGRSAARGGLKAEFTDSKPADIKAKSIESLREVSTLLTAKAPADAAAFKGWLRQISQSTAEAATEGGSLFGGGVQVSDAEKATLGEISSALGV